jgi:hypothetical protein
MRIEITDIDLNKSHILREKTISYEARFKSKIASGSAYIVPYGKNAESLKVGKIISVETDIESVESLEVLENQTDPDMVPLEKPFSYLMIGQVVMNTEDTVFDIDVGDLPIAIDIDETKGVILEKGMWIKFVVSGLSFWDENI